MRVVLCLSNMKELCVFFNLFFSFFPTLGPPLPKAIEGFPMLEMNGDTYVIGGMQSWGQSNDAQSSIYQLSCSSGLCRWSTLNQQLKDARGLLVAIAVQDNYCT